MITETPKKTHLGSKAKKFLVVTETLCIFFLGCEKIDQIQNEFRDLTPHEAYQESLVAAGLNETALARDWLEAAESSVVEAPPVDTPYQEEGFFPADIPQARGYKVFLRRGQQLSVLVTSDTDSPFRIFVDIYRLQSNENIRPLPVLSRASSHQPLKYVSPRAAQYVVRIQPELLRDGRYSIQIAAEGSMAFPVKDRNTRAILSSFGVERDGGRRQHHGVDIFAPRGTPVLSATTGQVSRVEDTPIGGKVVWVRDQGPNSIYYAHLDSQVVTPGARVDPGSLLGFVGNTGNARTTPPHLHFGVYRRGEGPVDPYYFLYTPAELPALRAGATRNLGDWSRTIDSGIRLRNSPNSKSAILRQMDKHTSFLILGTTGTWDRVLMPDNQVGFVASRLTEDIVEPLETSLVEVSTPLMRSPTAAASMIELVEAGSGIEVLGQFENYLYVGTRTGAVGWIARISESLQVEQY
jgi:murein DD-endopeptidase MepM/ murein hydrolase activator NlpD